jgi:multiple sugar transport system substrate-binding protein
MASKSVRTLANLGLTAALVALSACSAQKDSSTSEKKSDVPPAAQTVRQINGGKPITIKVYQFNAGITDTEFQELLAAPVQKKYPNVTLELLRSGKGTTIEELIAANAVPDIIYTTTLDMTKFVVLETLADLNPLVAKTKFDLNQFDQNPIHSIKMYSDKNELFALPIRVNWNVLYYNKDIFDRNAIPYPKDGITWEEVLDIGRKLAAKDPAIRAIDPNSLRLVAQNMLIPFVDPKTDKSAVSSPEWKYLFQLFKDIEEIQDNKNTKKGVAGFEQDQTLAMYGSSAGRLAEFEDLYNQSKMPNWDMVTYPIRAGAPTKEQVTQAHILAVSSTSKMKDDVFEIVSFLTTNMEAQEIIAKNGFLPALKDPKLRDLFGKNLKSLQGKNVAAVYKNVYGSMAKPSRYDDLIKDANQKAFDQMIKEKLDINTAIRIAQETGDKAIAAEKAKLGNAK